MVKISTELVDMSRFPKHFPSVQEQWSKHPEYPAADIEWIFVSDLLNFGFWSDEDENLGYSSIIKALNEHRVILCNPQHYSKLLFSEFIAFMPKGLPMLPERHKVLTEAGKTLLDYFKGSFTSFLRSSRGPDEFIPKLCQFLPSFRDDAGSGIWFLKRAQILVADLWASGAWFSGEDAIVKR